MKLPKDQSTLVLPGGETRCIFSTSTPFAFQVIPGDTDKLLLYFQGGGACWDQSSTKLGFCTTDSTPQNPVGVFDRYNANNPYKQYTIVHVLYCSGDVFGGDVIRSYTDSAGVPVQQKGAANAQSAIDWIVQQQGNGGLSGVLSSLVVMGCSAGSIGAQLWSDSALKALKFNKAAIVPDSYAGVFPDGSQGPLMYDFGFCTAFKNKLSSATYQKCIDKTLTIQDVDVEYISAHQKVPFSFIQSKTDSVQQAFYVAIAGSMNLPAALTPADFYTLTNTVFKGYNTYPNFLTYLVNGNQHCFTPTNVYYTADPISATDNGASTSSELMYQWTGNFPLTPGESEKTICDGTLKYYSMNMTSSSVSKESITAVDRTTYCDKTLASKKYTQK
eukprot:CAMPEP_0174820430 /NCGR_PEP_ID=MMETSP1107-20130205/4264_1 /TAXON_ID=36770 /ORGANISM="Paraphysomonas vestita, Strain GFlagA" /LENGTH=386 /DNA_ID=CAMNT_0016035773 /DNA_START=126 /DNA_END=1286 /DNA_ORIENTATION=-